MRKITSIWLHCTATPAGRHVTVGEIDRWHRMRGFRSPSGVHIGYHYVIYLDGSVHEGRPVAEAGAHVKGYNEESIGICYVGGLVPGAGSDGQTAPRYLPADTRTPAQRQAMHRLILQLMHQYGLSPDEVRCHNEVARKACPGFSRETIIGELANLCL